MQAETAQEGSYSIVCKIMRMHDVREIQQHINSIQKTEFDHAFQYAIDQIGAEGVEYEHIEKIIKLFSERWLIWGYKKYHHNAQKTKSNYLFIAFCMLALYSPKNAATTFFYNMSACANYQDWVYDFLDKHPNERLHPTSLFAWELSKHVKICKSEQLHTYNNAIYTAAYFGMHDLIIYFINRINQIHQQANDLLSASLYSFVRQCEEIGRCCVQCISVHTALKFTVTNKAFYQERLKIAEFFLEENIKVDHFCHCKLARANGLTEIYDFLHTHCDFRGSDSSTIDRLKYFFKA